MKSYLAELHQLDTFPDPYKQPMLSSFFEQQKLTVIKTDTWIRHEKCRQLADAMEIFFFTDFLKLVAWGKFNACVENATS